MEFRIQITDGAVRGEYNARGFVPFDQAVHDKPVSFLAEGFLSQLESLRESMSGAIRGEAEYDSKFVEEYGIRLYRGLFQGDIKGGLDFLLRMRRDMQPPTPPLRIRIECPPALAVLPWELMFRPGKTGHFLIDDPAIVLVRSTGVLQPPVAVQLPLKVLLVVCAPRDRTPLDARAEIDAMLESLKPMITAGMLAVDFLHGATFPRMGQALEAGYHALHLIGHGEELDNGEIDLVLEDGRRMSSPLEATGLWLNLRAVPHPRLAVLNICKGALAVRRPPFASLAEVFLKAGIPAVVAHQFEISDGAAARFSTSLYGEVARGRDVTAAVETARQNIHPGFERHTPVLLLQQETGAVFSVIPAPAGPPPAAAAWVNNAQLAFQAGRWSEAASYAQEALLIQPGDGVVRLKERALAEERLDTYLHEAYFGAISGDWAEAARFYAKYETEAGTRLNQKGRDRIAQLRSTALAGVGIRDPWLQWRG